ncbi:MAG: geranylgeranylglycerol-phosphate geranylgeranyltransferase [Algoriphagus sp.]|nr:geranylgeranylglycerol-phosphate geranylgeranyltransferase [Algoriphagus sp.]
MERTLSLRSLFRISRPINLLLIAFAQVMTAHFLVETNAQGLPALQDFRLYLLIMATLLVTAAGYMINDYYDVKIDYINRPKAVVVGKGIKRRMILMLHPVFNFVAIGMGWVVAPRIAALIIFAGVMLWWYCNGLKRKPFIGNVAVAFLTSLSIYLVAYYFQKNELLVFTYALFAFFLTLIRELLKDIEDRQGDRLHGSKTLPIVLGFRKTKQVIYSIAITFVGAILTVSFQLNHAHLYYYFGSLGLIFCWFMWLIYRADRREQFTQLSAFAKAIMLVGTLSMAFL